MVIDRIEGDFAIIEFNGDTVDIPLSWLPQGSKEGDRIRLVSDPDPAARQSANARLKRLQAKDHLPDHIDL